MTAIVTNHTLRSCNGVLNALLAHKMQFLIYQSKFLSSHFISIVYMLVNYTLQLYHKSMRFVSGTQVMVFLLPSSCALKRVCIASFTERCRCTLMPERFGGGNMPWSLFPNMGFTLSYLSVSCYRWIFSFFFHRHWICLLTRCSCDSLMGNLAF